MQKYIDGNSIANEVRMTRSVFRGSILIVEGQQSDVKVFSKLTDPEECKLIPAHGKENVLLSSKILNRNNFKGFLAIVDADFWRIDKVPVDNNVLLTDYHDLEIMMLMSPALEKVLVEFSSETKIQNFQKVNDLTIREFLLDLSLPIGCCRYHSLKNELNLKFEGMKFNKFFNNALVFEIHSFVRHIKNISNRHDLSESEIIASVEHLIISGHSVHDMCCGHDMISILSLGLRSLWGTNSSSETAHDVLERSVRLAYESRFFTTTNLFKMIKQWEVENMPYKVLEDTPDNVY